MLEKLAVKVDDGWGGFMYEIKPLGYCLLIALVVLLLVVIALLHSKRTNKQESSRKQVFSTKQLAFSAIAIALAVVASNIKLFRAPMGGSITLLSMFFVCLVGYWYGIKVSLAAAIAYGVLQMIIDPYIISIPQLFIDYILAFGALGLSGLFHNKKQGLLKGYMLGVFGRYIFSVISGLVFFASYAAEYDMSPLVYSLAYNGYYIGIEAAITIVVILIPAVATALKTVKSMAQSA